MAPGLRCVPLMRAAFLLLALCACEGGSIMVPPSTVTVPAPTVVSGALTEGEALHRTEQALPAGVVSVGRVNDSPVIATADGVLQLQGTSFVALPVGAAGEAMSTGAVHFLAPRSTGLLAVAEGGLFHDWEGHLLRSPLSDSLAMVSVQAIDAFGSGGAEELWLVEAGALSHVANGHRATLTLQDGAASQTVDVAVAAGANKAVVSSGDRLYRLDLAANTAAALAAQVPTISAFAHADDGTVYLATVGGLITVRTDDTVTLTTFAADGAAGQAVSDVAVLDSELFAVSGGRLVTRGATGFTTVANVAAPIARGLTIDSHGAVFAVDGAVLARLSSDRPVSFATDVKPFMNAHCQSCHATGLQYAPIRAFDTLEVSSQYADLIIKRLKADGTAPMPPPNSEVLTPDQYAVVLRWVQGGKQP